MKKRKFIKITPRLFPIFKKMYGRDMTGAEIRKKIEDVIAWKTKKNNSEGTASSRSSTVSLRDSLSRKERN